MIQHFLNQPKHFFILCFFIKYLWISKIVLVTIGLKSKNNNNNNNNNDNNNLQLFLILFFFFILLVLKSFDISPKHSV